MALLFHPYLFSYSSHSLSLLNVLFPHPSIPYLVMLCVALAGDVMRAWFIHQAFSDYQLQQMTSNFIDQFGFNEEEFGEQEEKTE